MPIAGDKMIELTRFSIEEAQFVATRVKPLKVIHLARRLAPILMVLKTLQSTAGAAPLDVDPGDPVPGKPAPKPPDAPDLSADKWLPALVEAVAGLSDDDANYVLRECLSVTQQVRPIAATRSLWLHEVAAPVDWLTAGEILTIAGKVLGKTFMDLMDELPSLGIEEFKTEALGAR